MQRYPSPPRKSNEINNTQAVAHGFVLCQPEPYENQQRFTLDELVDYLTTQSNINVVVEGGVERIEDVRAWLATQCSPFFAQHTQASFVNSGVIFYLQKKILPIT